MKNLIAKLKKYRHWLITAMLSIAVLGAFGAFIPSQIVFWGVILYLDYVFFRYALVNNWKDGNKTETIIIGLFGAALNALIISAFFFGL